MRLLLLSHPRYSSCATLLLVLHCCCQRTQMAPEIRLQQPYNEKIDVYAFAILLYEVWSRSLLAVSHVGTKRPDMPEMIHKCEQFPDLIVSGWRPARAGAIPEPIWQVICGELP